MRRLTLHLLLVFTLILNGISAPSAMAQMSHGDHGKAGHAAVATATPAASGDHAHHGHHAMAEAVEAGATTDTPPADHDRTCCNGTNCACGCVLPPALGLVTRLPAVPAHAPIVFVFPAAHAQPGHETHPFRPPAA